MTNPIQTFLWLFEKGGDYSRLRVDLIQDTIDDLCIRIRERFPNSGLSRVGLELAKQGMLTDSIVRQLSRPYWPLRLLSIIGVIFIIGVVGILGSRTLQLAPGAEGSLEWIQAIEAAINEVIFLAIALYFLLTVEVRFKRQIALKALHRLRSIAHVIDMHQLTKDPAYVLAEAKPTPSSPIRTMSDFELVRYLDYCTELLSLTSKLAALYVQYLNDPVVLEAVNDLESLSDGLSHKIWQKITILDLAVPQSSGPELLKNE